VDLCASGVYAVRDRIRGVDDRVHADAFAGASWKDRYFIELDASGRADWHSYGYWRSRPFHGDLINVDERGIRRTWNPPECTSSSSKLPVIFTFGGSTMWGVGSRDDYTIPSELARALAQRGHPACVINFGQWGYVNSQELMELVVALREGSRPDVVLFYDGDNDAFSAFQQGVAGLPQNESNRRREFNLQSEPGEMMLLTTARLLTHSGLFRLAESVRTNTIGDKPGSAVAHPPDVHLARAVVAAYEGNVHLIQALGGAYRFRSIFYWQPLVFDKHVQTSYETARARWDASFGRFWHQVEGEVRASELTTDPGFHNLGEAFAAETNPIYMDFAHTSEAGNRMLAGHMTGDVVAALTSER
jgi:hypothetical protein